MPEHPPGVCTLNSAKITFRILFRIFPEKKLNRAEIVYPPMNFTP
jgi:hypothetical protein